MNYEQDIEIDENSLDLEWLNQASLFMKYARHSAETRRDVDEAKQNLDIVKSELDFDIRKRPDKYLIDKVTEGAISAAILIETKYKETYQKYLDAKFEADMASNAVSAFNMRKEALENLVRLHGQQYFAGPKVPHDLTTLREERRKNIDEGISSRINTRRRRANENS